MRRMELCMISVLLSDNQRRCKRKSLATSPLQQDSRRRLTSNENSQALFKMRFYLHASTFCTKHNNMIALNVWTGVETVRAPVALATSCHSDKQAA